MEIIKEMQKHISDQNIDYIEELADIILEENITNLEELKKYEIEYNSMNDNYSLDLVINNYLNEIDNNPFEYEGCLYDFIQALKQERKLIDTDSIENKIYHLIRYCKMTKRDNPLPYETYKLIINGKL